MSAVEGGGDRRGGGITEFCIAGNEDETVRRAPCEAESGEAVSDCYFIQGRSEQREIVGRGGEHVTVEELLSDLFREAFGAAGGGGLGGFLEVIAIVRRDLGEFGGEKTVG